jgi:hypothetical protein
VHFAFDTLCFQHALHVTLLNVFVLLIVSLITLVLSTPRFGTVVLSYLSYDGLFLARFSFFTHLHAFAYLIFRDVMTTVNIPRIDCFPSNNGRIHLCYHAL